MRSRIPQQATTLEIMNFVLEHYNIGERSPSRVTYSKLPSNSVCPPLLIEADQGRFVLKSIAFDESAAQFIVSVALKLKAEGLPIVKIVRRNDCEKLFFQLRGRYYILYEFVPGLIKDPLNTGSTDFERAGKMLARIHLALRGFTPEMKKIDLPTIAILETNDDFEYLGQTLLAMKRAGSYLSRSGNLFLEHFPFIMEQLGILVKNLPLADYNALPHSVIYGDLNLTNLVFSGRGEIIALCDIESVRVQPRIEDFKNPITNLGPNRSRIFRRGLYELFLKSYQRILRLDEKEVVKLPEIIRGAFLWSVADLFLLRREEIDKDGQVYRKAQDALCEFKKFSEQF